MFLDKMFLKRFSQFHRQTEEVPKLYQWQDSRSIIRIISFTFMKLPKYNLIRWSCLIEDQYGRFYYKFFSMKIIALVVIFFAFEVHSQTTFYFNFDTFSKYSPSYGLGVIQAGTIIQINATSPSNNGPNAFNMGDVLLTIQTDTYPASGISCIGGCASASTCFFTCSVLTTQSYRLNVSKNNSPANKNGNNPKVLQHFQLLVISHPTVTNTTEQNNTVLLKVTQTFRDRIAKLIYISSTYQAQFSLYPAVESATDTPNLGKSNLHLYKVSSVTGSNNVYDINAASDILTNPSLSISSYASINKTLSYQTTLQQGFYVLVATYQRQNVNFIRLSFSSDNYICPFSLNYPDYYSNFQGCSASPPLDPGFPCLAFDHINGVCMNCATTYSLVNGTCKVLNMCPPRQYFHFGECYPVQEECLNYNSFTGQCLSCKEAAMIIQEGRCVRSQVQCQARQYLKDGVCIDISPLCQLYSTDTGECFSCLEGAHLSNKTCLTVVITCGSRQYLYNSICYDIPALCAQFDIPSRRCLICTTGYYLNNASCLPIQCLQRHYLDGNDCKEVSILCDNYDPVSGDCLSCKYSGYSIRNGKCLQVTSPLAGCKQREMLGFGSCGDAIQNCLSYNLVTKNCEQCIEGWFFDYTGKCTEQHKQCRDDQVSVQGICIQRPQNCLKVDDLGLCVQCNGTALQLQYGQCVYIQKCPEGKFLVGAQCVNVTPGCQTYNPTTGQCLTCLDGRAAVEDLCCPQGQVAYKTACYDQKLVPTGPTYVNNQPNSVPYCIAYHPTLKYCLQCNANYEVDQSDMMTCK